MSRLVHVLDDKEVIERLHSSVKRAGGQSAFARQTGIERSHLNMVLNGKRPPTRSVLDVLNLQIVYARKLPDGRQSSLGELRRIARPDR